MRNTKRLGKENVIIITQWELNDALVQNYTLPYVSMVRKYLRRTQALYVVTAEKLVSFNRDLENNQANIPNCPGVVHIPLRYHRFGARKILSQLGQIMYLYLLVKRRNIGVIHCFCMPAGAIGYMVSKMTGASLILDSYEPHAESMVENGTWLANSVPYITLKLLESLQSKRAAAFIATTEGMWDYALKQYSVEAYPFFVKPACVDLVKYNIRRRDQKAQSNPPLNDKFVCVYAGKIGGIYLDGEIIEFIHEAYNILGDKFKFLLLSPMDVEGFLKRLEQAGIPRDVTIVKSLPHYEIPYWLNLADFALNPVKPVNTKKYCTSIKDGEYWASGLPVVIPKNISDDSAIIKRYDIGYVLEELTKAEYRKAVTYIQNLYEQYGRDTLQTRVRSVALQYRSYSIAESIYKELYS